MKPTTKQVETIDAIKSLGKLLDESFQRDAVHIAVVPVVAAVRLQPGQHVGLVYSGIVQDHRLKDLPWVADGDVGKNLVGIIDPFLQHAVEPTQVCWLFLYPRTITSLRHVWTHPEFDDEPVVKSERLSVQQSWGWIERYAKSYEATAEEFIAHAKDYVNGNNYWTRGAIFEGETLDPDFWDHFEVVTGGKVPEDKKESFFSCSC